uniref:Uncharacterized protein n=1 Tax=Romanomermis culicivorax TaxID=13658 RepID=A0A915KXS3_ROMCU
MPSIIDAYNFTRRVVTPNGGREEIFVIENRKRRMEPPTSLDAREMPRSHWKNNLAPQRADEGSQRLNQMGVKRKAPDHDKLQPDKYQHMDAKSPVLLANKKFFFQKPKKYIETQERDLHVIRPSTNNLPQHADRTTEPKIDPIQRQRQHHTP